MQHHFKRSCATLLLLLFICNYTVLQANNISNDPKEPQKEKHTKFQFYGNVRNDFTFDSRQNLAVVGELFYFIPLDKKINSLGEDLNATPNTRLLAITSRVGVDMTSELNNCLISAKIETDFCGAGLTYVMFRIRHAYVNFLWKNTHKLLVGQAWHPMSEGMLPSIVSLNTGAPFNSFSRAPQVRYDYLAKRFSLTASATYQLQYTSSGPIGPSSRYQVFGGYPEINMGVSYKSDAFQVNLMGNYLGIKPRTTGTIDSDEKVLVNDFVHALSGSLYAAYSKDLWNIKARTILGQNLGHLLMLSGYGVSNILDNGSYEYSSLTQSTSWLNITYGKKYLFGLFGAYMKNLGAAEEIKTDMIYCRGFDNIDQMFRVAPSFRYNIKDICIGVEYEYTGVMYGETINPNASVSNTHLVGNHRLYAMLIYSFSTKKK